MKFLVTPELAILLKTIRTQNGVSSKDLAAAVGKSPSYISKLESGSVKSVQQDLLTRIITFISEGEDFYEECLPAAVKTLNSFIEPERAFSQSWLLQYDIVERPILLPEEMVVDLKARMEELGVGLPQVVNWVNANIDSEMSGTFPENVVLSLPYEEGDRLLVRVHLNLEDVEKLFAEAPHRTNHLTAHSLVFTVMRLMEFGPVEEKLKPDKAVVVLKDTATYMGQYDIHTLTGFSHMLSSEEFTSRQQPLAWPYENVEVSVMNEAISFFNEAMEHDALNTKKALDSLMDALNWDPAFTMKLISIPFSELEGLSFQNKRKLLDEILALVNRYNQMSDFEKRLETY